MSIRVTEPNGQRTIDNQIQELVSAIELGPQWLEKVLSIIRLKDEIHRVQYIFAQAGSSTPTPSSTRAANPEKTLADKEASILGLDVTNIRKIIQS